MDNATRQFIENIINNAKDLTLATVRADGYPQATTVSFANDGMTLYIGIGALSQKAGNISRNNKVSLTINAPYRDWNEIRGLSLGGTAEFLSDPADLRHAAECMKKRFPQIVGWDEADPLADVTVIKIVPQVMSLIDYTKGFGHTELLML